MKLIQLTPFLLLSGNSVLSQTSDGCYTSLTEIGQKEDTADVREVREYILCAETTFNLGSLDNNDDIIGGDFPLALRANMRVLCGEDGSVDNNCIFNGGSFGVAAFLGLYGFGYLDNVFISGITFDGQKQHGSLILLPGKITYSDCIFKNMGNLAPLRSQWQPDLFFGDNGTRFLDGEARPSWRRTQFSPVLREPTPEDVLEVSLINCAFRNNVAIELPQGAGAPALIFSPGAVKTTIQNSIFENNAYTEQGRVFGFLLLGDGGEVIVEDNCFTDNEVVGPAPLLFISGNATASNNEYNPPADNARCGFLGVLDSLDQGLGGPISTCLEAESDSVCPAATNEPAATGAPVTSEPAATPEPTMRATTATSAVLTSRSFTQNVATLLSCVVGILL